MLGCWRMNQYRPVRGRSNRDDGGSARSWEILVTKKGGRFGTKRRFNMNEQSPTLTNYGEY